VRSIIHPSRRSAAAFAALVLAVTGVGLSAPAAGSPLSTATAVDAPVTDRTPNWMPELGSTATAEVFDDANARLDMGAPEVAPAANPTVFGVVNYRTEVGGPALGLTSGFGLVRFWLEVTPGLFELEREIDTFVGAGEFTTSILPAGTYIVEFIHFNDPARARIYWNDEAFFFAATELTISDDASYDLGTVIIEPRTLDFFRIEGPSRFDTAVAISQTIWPSEAGPIPYVYIINGLGYADALSAGPAAASRGGLLMPVLKTSIPAAVQAELTRLQPEKIIVVGSPLAISLEVEAELEAYVTDSDDIERIAGASRYDTSLAIVNEAFSTDSIDSIFISTGRNYPDALAAGPAAHNIGGAVLLVDGLSTSGINASQRQLLIDLGRPDLFITGGANVFTESVVASLEETLDGDRTSIRLAGTSRFDTARVINAFAFGFTETYPDFALVANGLGYADALTGGPLAAALGAPMYLSLPTCLSQDVFGDLLDLIVTEAYALGSPLALSDNVLYGDFC